MGKVTLVIAIIILIILLLLVFIINQSSRIVNGVIYGISNNNKPTTPTLVVFPNQNGTAILPSEGKNIKVEANPNKSLTIKLLPGNTLGREITITNTSKTPNAKIKIGTTTGVSVPNKLLLPGDSVHYTCIRDNVYLMR